MKPYTTIEKLDGSSLLPAQLVGIARNQLSPSLVGDEIVAIGVPETESLKEAWFAQLSLASGRILEFTASSTRVDGWEELATINVRLLGSLKEASVTLKTMLAFRYLIQSVHLVKVRLGEFDTEAAISIGTEEGELVIAASDLPGQISIELPTKS